MRRLRFAPPVAVAISIALLTAGVSIAVYSERSYTQDKLSDVNTQAKIIASLISAAVTFDDRDAALEYLNALKENTDTVAAAVYDADGRYFAGFSAAADWSLPDDVSRQSPARFDSDRVTVTAPVTRGDVRVGTVLLRSIVEPFSSRLARYGGIVLLFAMGALMLVILGLATRALTATNAELAKANAALSREIAERESTEAALRQAQKMETIGQLTGGVAHDFNNLLTIVLGNLERLLRRLREGARPEDLSGAAESALRGGRRAAQLTQSLLAFARRQPLNPSALDLNRLVSNISDLLRRTLGELVTIENVVGAGLWKTFADPNQLENAIINLAVNARDAMPNGGKLTIETANAHLDDEYARQHRDIAAGQYVMLAVTDTGLGMPPDVVDRVFEPFFTTKEQGYGTGLGLSQVYGFVKQSGGHVSIYSEVGEGTTIKIYFPRYQGETAAVEREQQRTIPPPAERRTVVLVVEDDDEVRAYGLQLIEDLGYCALEASNGPAALQIIENNPEVAILFTDIGLPGGMNGRQLADAAQLLRPDLKVLCTTGYARNAIVHDGRLDPGVHLVTKPFSYSSVGWALANILGEADGRAAVLLVEDELLIRMNVASDLREMGFNVYEASTADDALKLFTQQRRFIAAAIIDIGLVGKKGDELGAEIRALEPALPIVFASGYDDDRVRRRFPADDRVRFLTKPYVYEGLAAALLEAGVRAPTAARGS